MRLIDADRLSDVINNIDYVPVCIDCYAKHEILELIDEQPTAYDVGKVAERLEKLPTCSNWNHNSNNIDRRLAIEIVKEGGVNE